MARSPIPLSGTALPLLLLTLPVGVGCAGGGDHDPAAQHITTADDLSPGDDCQAGGTLIRSGTDADGDGELMGDEVERTFHVCNGVAGSVLSRTQDADAAACPGGGSVIEFGNDTDGDGELGDAEVSGGTTVCDALQALVSVTMIGGAPCPRGGLRVDTGQDDDGDGVLDPDEIDTTEHVCNGVDLGVQAGISAERSLSALTAQGWHVCYQQPYSAFGPGVSTAAALRAACADAGAYLIAGCTHDSVDPDHLEAAAGDASAVVLPADDDPTAAGYHRPGAGQVGWYLSEDWSFGFFEAGDGVDRNSADTSGGNFPERRMSWHTHADVGGYRCGAAADLNDADDYTKYILAR